MNIIILIFVLKLFTNSTSSINWRIFNKLNIWRICRTHEKILLHVPNDYWVVNQLLSRLSFCSEQIRFKKFKKALILYVRVLSIKIYFSLKYFPIWNNFEDPREFFRFSGYGILNSRFKRSEEHFPLRNLPFSTTKLKSIHLFRFYDATDRQRDRQKHGQAYNTSV